MKRTISLATLALSMASAAASAQTTVSVVADVDGISAGDSFRVAAVFDVEPGWHIYWSHPGDSGLPTTVTATAPDGVTVGEFRLPVPDRFGQPGGLAGFGYSGAVAFVAEVETDADITGPVTIELAADWLMCADRCIPGAGKGTVSIDVAEPRASTNADRFIAWLDEMPASTNQSAPFELGARWGRADDGDGGQVEIDVTWPDGAPANVDWIPNPGPSVLLEHERRTELDDGLHVSFSWTTWDDASPSPFHALVVWTDADGRRRGHEVSFPIN